MVLTIRVKNSAPEIIGTVMWRNWRQELAPSSRAASYSSLGTLLRAAR